MGMNRVPDLPPGVSVSDVEEVTAGELVSAVTLRSGIEGYTGSRLILRGPTLLTGTSDGTISYGNGVLDYTDKTTWNTALQGASGVMGLDRVGFGHLFGALIRKPSGSPVPVASGRFKDQFSGDLAFLEIEPLLVCRPPIWTRRESLFPWCRVRPMSWHCEPMDRSRLSAEIISSEND